MRFVGHEVDLHSGWRRRRWSAAVTPAIPFPITTTRLTSRSKLKFATRLMCGTSSRSGVSATLTGPVTRTQHAIRVFGAKPSRSSVAFSSSETAEVHSIPSLIATGSAPQMPIRQPASIVMPLDSAISSSDWPGLGHDALVLGNERDLGEPWRFAARDSDAALTEGTRASAGRAVARSRNGFSLRTVRRNQMAASAIAAARTGHSRARATRRRTSRRG